MSLSEDLYQAARWLATADEDARATEVLLEAGLYAHACFAAQQAGEKAVKALWYAVGEDPRGHSVQKLVARCPLLEQEPERGAWLETAAALDRFYVPTRYPNGLPDLTPEQSYFRRDAEQAREQALWVVQACRRVLAGLTGG
jgi:HEPN domain-containing protein